MKYVTKLFKKRKGKPANIKLEIKIMGNLKYPIDGLISKLSLHLCSIIIPTLNPLISGNEFHANTSHCISSSFHDISRILLSLQPEIYLLSKHVCNPVKYDKWDSVQHTYSTQHSNEYKKPVIFFLQKR